MALVEAGPDDGLVALDDALEDLATHDSRKAGEEFAPDKSASAGPVPAESPAVHAGGPSRRKGSGAAAREKNGCDFPQRRQPNRAAGCQPTTM